ncbi:MAG: HNH endonuclease family protein, partial [Kineosporiaceae bacterium]
TGERVTFAKARASEVQIDHIVALADAWRSGAWAWTDERRELFANDFDEIQASSAAANRAKSDHDAATWSPEGADRSCTWARQVVEIKTHWGLSVDPDEAAGLATMLAACPA